MKVGVVFGQHDGEDEVTVQRWIPGEFLANPGFRLKFDSAHVLKSARADVALITLKHDAPKEVHVALLADAYPAKGADVVIVGFGLDEQGTIGFRHAGRNHISDAVEDEIVIGRDGATAFRGDSGGALFAAGMDGDPRLLGVVSNGAFEEPTHLVSTFYYRAFLARALGQEITVTQEHAALLLKANDTKLRAAQSEVWRAADVVKPAASRVPRPAAATVK